MKAPQPSPDVWVDERLRVRASGIEGDGLFADSEIAAGEIVIRLGGRLVSTEDLERLIAAADADPSAAYVDTFSVEDDEHVVLPPGTPAHFANHSCEPNLWLVSPYAIATRRDVVAGAEVTIDYATISAAPGFWMQCSCGSELCRGFVSSEDWLRTDLAERYRDHWAPVLQRRIERSGERG